METINQLILAYSLRLICKGLDKPGKIQDHLLNESKIEELFMNGLLSTNNYLRRPYLEAIAGILENSLESNQELFKRLYLMLKKGLGRELSSLTS